MEMIEKQVAFRREGDEVIVKHSQEIPDWFLTEIADARNAQDNAPMGDFCRVAVVPEETVDRWKREGFDIYKEPAQAIVSRLKAEELTAFLTTTKRI